MELTQEHIKQFVTAISTLDGNINFEEFCRILKFHPKYTYAKQKWEQFHQLSAALNYFDLDCLTKLVEAYEQQKADQ